MDTTELAQQSFHLGLCVTELVRRCMQPAYALSAAELRECADVIDQRAVNVMRLLVRRPVHYNHPDELPFAQRAPGRNRLHHAARWRAMAAYQAQLDEALLALVVPHAREQHKSLRAHALELCAGLFAWTAELYLQEP